jgi:hypothetical protein
MLSIADYTPPATFTSLVQLQTAKISEALQVQWIQLNGNLLSFDYFEKLRLMLLEAWTKANPSLCFIFVFARQRLMEADKHWLICAFHMFCCPHSA